MLIERTIKNRELQITCEDDYTPMAENVLDVFEKLAAGEKIPADGMQVRFGWSMLRLQENGHVLQVTEPDFDNWPAQNWNNNLNTTLRVLSAQTALLHRLKMEGEDVYFDQAVILVRNVLPQSDIFMRRTLSTLPDDSGWLIGSLNNPEELSDDSKIEAMQITRL
ncbi:MAG: hypothetical protein JWQ57_17, partial [Mucilaginibacter sp.]|nr:hypothetical protein [Mucilaginibacter sp.]